MSDSLPPLPAPINPIKDLEARARDLADTLRKAHSRLVWAQLGTLGLAAALGIVEVVSAPVRDWLLFVGMYLVLFAYVIAYLKAWAHQRRFVAAISLVFAESLLGFFAWILSDRAPARKVVFDGTVINREDLPLLWVSAALLILSGVLLLIHWVYTGAKRRRLAAAPAVFPASEPAA